MRPPILQWKVMLALVAVVLVAVTLGSALRASPRPANTLLRVPVGGWTAYTARPTKQEMRIILRSISVAPKPETPQDRLRAWFNSLRR